MESFSALGQLLEGHGARTFSYLSFNGPPVIALSLTARFDGGLLKVFPREALPPRPPLGN